MDLREALARFDGVHTDALKAAMPSAREDRVGLVAACFEAELEVAATWVVKAFFEAGESEGLTGVVGALPGAQNWAAQLHILQCVRFLPEAAVPVVGAIRPLLSSKRALVRVWALDAFVRVAEVRAELRLEAKGLVEEALEGGGASLRARARDLNVICARW